MRNRENRHRKRSFKISSVVVTVAVTIYFAGDEVLAFVVRTFF